MAKKKVGSITVTNLDGEVLSTCATLDEAETFRNEAYANLGLTGLAINVPPTE